jgi:hypothetical protein
MGYAFHMSYCGAQFLKKSLPSGVNIAAVFSISAAKGQSQHFIPMQKQFGYV